MNQTTWQGKLRQMRGEFKREWGKFTHNDRRRLEGEIDRILGQMQQRYGYTRARAWNELDRYWQDYGRAGQAAMRSTLKGFRRRNSSTNRFPWLMVVLGVVTFLLVMPRLRQLGSTARQLAAKEKKRQESIRREQERDLVDEQSWESFPASDPPASW